MLKPVKILLSILGVILTLVVVFFILCGIAWLMNTFGAGENAFVEFMYNIMRFLNFVN